MKATPLRASVGRLFVARHAQTDLNADRVLQGPRFDGGLSELGLRQAAALGRAAATYGLSAMYTSPMLRARETAQAVVEALGGQISARQVPELYEVDYGALTGRPLDEIRSELEQVLDAWRMGFPNEAFPGGESAQVAQHRILPFARRLRRQATTDDVLVIGHGRLNRILLATLLGTGLTSLEEYPQSNACITELAVGDEVQVVRLNDTGHLGDLAGEPSVS